MGFSSIVYLYPLSSFPVSHLGLRFIWNQFLFILRAGGKGSFFPPYEYPIDLISFFKRSSFFHLLQWYLYYESDDCIYVYLFLQSFLFFCLLTLWQYCPVLITVDFKQLLVFASINSPTLFFFKIVFVFLGFCLSIWV